MVARVSKYFFYALLLALTSCFMIGPDYKEPEKKIASHWLRADSTVKESPIHSANWWQTFHDPTLSCLINIGYHGNLDLQSVAVKVLQSRAMLAHAVGKLYPQQQAVGGNLIYQETGGQQFQFILPSSYTTTALMASAAWEIDFWGKYRRTVLSHDASFFASYAAYDNALVSLTSNIASTYIKLRTTQELMKATEDNIKLQEMSLKLTETRYREGQVNRLDVEFAKTELYRTKSTIPQYRANIQMFKDLLSVLLGVTIEEVDKLTAKSYGIPMPSLNVAVGIPKEAISSRPDVFQARMEAISALQNIGAVKANLLPAFTLSGTFGLSANDIGPSSLSELFNWSSRYALAGPSVSWPILNYGQITNLVRGQDAVFQEALLKYMQSVLKAQQEVQDNITALIESRKSVADLLTSFNAAKISTRISLIRYKEGESDFVPVLNALRQQLSVEISLTSRKGDIPGSLVSLYRSIGGGWQIRGQNDIVSEQVKAEMAKRTNWGDLLLQKNHQPPKNKEQEIKELYLPNW